MSRVMKDSGIPWIGEIPEGWNCLPFKRGVIINNGRDYKDVESYSGIPVIGSGGQFAWANQPLYDGEAILLGRKGTIDRPLYVNCKFWTVDTMFYAIPKPNIHGRYMYYQALTIPFSLYSTSTALPSMTQSNLANNPMCFPPLAEQEAIAAFLDRKCGEVDAMVSLQEQVIEELKAYKQSVITEAVTKGLNPNAPMKPSNIDWIGQIPEHWETTRLRFLCTIKTGDSDTQDAEQDGIYPFYVRSPKIERSNKYTFEGEGILMAGDGAGAGRVFHHAYGKYAVHQRVYRLSNFRKINTNYLFYFTSTLFSRIMDRGSAQSTVPSVRLPMLTNFVVCNPPLSEQREIADYLDGKCAEIDALISLKQQKIEELREYKKSLIYEYVTGKKQV